MLCCCCEEFDWRKESLSMRRSLAYRLREAGVTESEARVLARQPAPVPEDPDRAFDAPEGD